MPEVYHLLAPWLDARSALTTIPAHRAVVCPECCQLDAWYCCSSATRSLPSVAAQGEGPSTKSSARESQEPSLTVRVWGLRCGTVASTALQLPDTPTERAMLLPIVPKHGAAK